LEFVFCGPFTRVFMHASLEADCSSFVAHRWLCARYVSVQVGTTIASCSKQRRAPTRERRGAHMARKFLISLGLSLSLGLAAIGCGDDEDDDDKKADVNIKAPGVDVKANGLTGAAGAAARGNGN
jgi:hypothetical protein